MGQLETVSNHFLHYTKFSSLTSTKRFNQAELSQGIIFSKQSWECKLYSLLKTKMSNEENYLVLIFIIITYFPLNFTRVFTIT